MEREIKFRGKWIDNGEWVYGDLIKTAFLKNATNEEIPYILDVTKADYDCFEDLDEENGVFEVDPSTVGQFTGLQDKEGKDIYEGDIVGYYSRYGNRWSYAIVKYGEFNCSCCEGVYGWYFDGGDIRDYTMYEVCGNLYDNKNLVGGD